jgi:hypothetical protein
MLGCRRPALALLVTAMLLGTGGCRLGLDVRMDVAAGGGGRLAVALAADQEARDRAAAAGADPLALVVEAGEGLRAEGWTVADETAPDGTRTVELAVEADDAEELSAQAAQLAEALSGPEADLLDPLVVTVGPDRIHVEGAAALEPGDAVADYGLTGEDAVRLLGERDALDYTVTVALPAEVLSANATGREASILTWAVEPGSRLAIRAEGVRPRFPWAAALAGAAGLLGLVALAFTLRRLRRPS